MGSFRIRIIVWTLVLSGVVLVAFGIVSDRAFYSMKLQDLDDRLKIMSGPRFPPPTHRRFWNRLAEFTQDGSRRLLDTETVVTCYASDRDVDPVFIGNWPEEDRSGLVAMLPASDGRFKIDSEPDFQSDALERLLAARERSERRGNVPWFAANDRRGREQGEVDFMTLSSQGMDWRFAVFRFPGYNVAVGARLDLVMEDVSRLRRAYFIALPLGLGVLAIGAWLLATRAIRPLRTLTTVASGISATHLDERIETSGEDKEFADLIRVFNGMLDRLERSFQQANRFSADAAHELKTPLSILQGHLERAIQTAPDDSEQQRTLASLFDEVLLLKSITRKLLILAQADTGHLPVTLESVNLKAQVRDVCEELGESADEIEVVYDLADTVEEVRVDPSLCRQIVQNLFTNAVKYNKLGGGKIWITLIQNAEVTLLRVENLCEPIPGGERPALFDRFTRRSFSRNRSSEGTGLGLSLAQEFARAHGGDLRLMPHLEDEKIGFEWSLPRRGA